MAAMMSGLESRLFPKSFTRGRDSSRGSSRRGSSVESRSPSSASRQSRSVSPSSHSLQSGPSVPSAAHDRKGALTGETRSKSEEALTKSFRPLPDYVKPNEEEEHGERLAKDVFDRDKNIIESSDEDDEISSEDEQISGGQVMHSRGRRKNTTDIRTITSSDFNKPRESDSSAIADCMLPDFQCLVFP